ncbi:MAG: DUF881 domain-containing protein [Armatimonadetes bacterium]|nr:DUF881 domain-containing protein [Armatimonadota bacterium]
MARPSPAALRLAQGSSLGKLRWQMPILLASVVLGVLITMQFRYVRNNPQPNINQDLSRMVKYLEVEKSRLIADLDEEREKKRQYEAAMGEKGDTLKLLKDEIDKVRMQAGLVPVKGPGVEVRLEDSAKKPGAEDDPYFFIIHDVDIQAFVNELWAAGAEAISVNDQRVVASTSVRCVGPTVLVNSVRLTPPYIIRAVGAPPTLETALKMPGGVMASLEASIQKGVRIDIQRKTEQILPEYKGSGVFRYAQPVDAR